jgi:hypothetical protein
LRGGILSKKKHTLSVSIEEDYCLLGISTDEPDYKLCWLINNRLKTDFVKVKDLELFHKKQQAEQSFPMFLFEDENAMLTYRLIGNKTENGYYLSDIRNIDFVLYIQGELVREDLDTLVAALNTIPSVRMCVPVHLSRIREKDRLHLW